MTLQDALIEAIQRQLPADAFRALLDSALPSIVETSEVLDLPLQALKALNGKVQDGWPEVMDHLLQQRPSHDWPLEPLISMLGNTRPDEPMALVVYGRLADALNDQQAIRMLALGLREGWSVLVDRVLQHGVTPDLSQTPMSYNPFYAVRTLSDLLRLQKHGFNPWQPDKGGTSGCRALWQRPLSQFRRPLAGAARWTSQGAKAALLKHLQPDNRESLTEQVRFALSFHSSWREASVILDTIGPAWMDAPMPDGGTVMHAMVVHRPGWVPACLDRKDVRARGAAWSSAPDRMGRHPWELVWLNQTTAGLNVGETGSVDDLERVLRSTPRGSAWLDVVPPRPGPQAFDGLLDAAIAWEKPLPSFNQGAWWDAMVARGGENAQDAWARVSQDLEVQRRIDHLVWEVLKPKTAGHAESWFNLDLWSDDPNPWLATYRLVSSWLFLVGETSDPVATAQHRRHLRRALVAIDDGADVPRVQEWLDAGKIWSNDERRKVWHRELLTVWEQRALRAVLASPLTVVPPSRRRL